MKISIDESFEIDWNFIKEEVSTILIYDVGMVYIKEVLDEDYWRSFSIIADCLIFHRP